jgi:hypothetical protein
MKVVEVLPRALVELGTDRNGIDKPRQRRQHTETPKTTRHQLPERPNPPSSKVQNNHPSDTKDQAAAKKPTTISDSWEKTARPDCSMGASIGARTHDGLYGKNLGMGGFVIWLVVIPSHYTK